MNPRIIPATKRTTQSRYRGVTTGHRIDRNLLENFDSLINSIAPYLSRNEAINLLIQSAVLNQTIPGVHKIEPGNQTKSGG
jgi:hypothetical protein